MIVVLAFALLFLLVVVLYVLERMERAGEAPLADSDRALVFDGTVVPVGGHVGALVDRGPAEPDPPVDAGRCIAESRLVTALIAGEVDRSEYQERMAELAANDAVTRPVRPPSRPS